MALISDDAVGFGQDPTTVNGFESYKSTDFAKLREYFYAVMLHGAKDSVFIGDDQQDPFMFAQKLKKIYTKYGKNRAILLISCWAGLAFARPLSRALNLPVVAGLSAVNFVTIYSKGASNKLQALDGEALEQFNFPKPAGKIRAEWVFVQPSGVFDVIPGGKFLDHNEAIHRAKKFLK